IVVARRVCADTEIPDRRGVARGARAAGGTEQTHAEDKQSVGNESVRTQSVAEGKQSISASGNSQPHNIAFPSATSRHAVDAGVTGQPTGDTSWKKGRGRPRMAESSYGRVTRRGKARKFLSSRDHAAKHDGSYERKQRVIESNTTTDKHTHKPNRQQERRESRQQSRRALNQYAGSLG
ncbi:MAG: hypothetical protein ABI852_20620, partial [Gemmatimonadaceae bacterium]